MPHPPRVFEPSGIYHLSARGSDRQAIFLYDTDRRDFLELLATVVERYDLSLVAYTLMGNHYHLLVQTPDSRLSRAMQKLNSSYSRHFNRVYGRSAHLFRNRFRDSHIDSDAYLLTALAYLAHNPVKAGLCNHPAQWPWSSYRATSGHDPTPRFLTLTPISNAFAGAANWQIRYRHHIEDPANTASLREQQIALPPQTIA